jgi:hypothetical protein
MMNRNRLAMACLVLVCGASVAHAQAAEDRRVEIGGGIGTVASLWTGPFPGGDVRLTVPVSERGDVETLFAVSPSGTGETLGFYGVQFRQRLRHARSVVEPFLTYGGIGIFYRDDGDSMVTPPVIGFVGGGVEHRVHRRLAVRVEAQAIVLLVVPIGVRVAAGVSVPIGRPRAMTR